VPPRKGVLAHQPRWVQELVEQQRRKIESLKATIEAWGEPGSRMTLGQRFMDELSVPFERATFILDDIARPDLDDIARPDKEVSVSLQTRAWDEERKVVQEYELAIYCTGGGLRVQPVANNAIRLYIEGY
jgi:hypothetical protein